MSHLLGLDTPDWNPRYRRNVIVYLWVYRILGAVTGITNNALLSYLDIAAPKVVTGLNTFSAISTLLMSLTILLVHRMGENSSVGCSCDYYRLSRDNHY